MDFALKKVMKEEIKQEKPRIFSVFQLASYTIDVLEAPSGFEPENEGFADLYLTAWLWRHKKMERVTRFGLATFTLAR